MATVSDNMATPDRRARSTPTIPRSTWTKAARYSLLDGRSLHPQRIQRQAQAGQRDEPDGPGLVSAARKI